MSNSSINQIHIYGPRGAWIRVALALTMLALVGFAGAHAAPPAPAAALVKEINTAERRFDGLAWATDLIAAGSHVFFRAGDPENGNELWVTDGTPSGTQLVYDIDPGPWNSSSSLAMLSVGERLFFSVGGEQIPCRLWVSDGTAAGTAQLGDTLDCPNQLTDVNGTVYFVAQNMQGSACLWRTDGTAGGTMQLFDFGAAGISSFERPTNVAGKLFFIGSDATHGRELWVSDATAAGTRMVADLNPDGDSFSPSESPELTVVGSTLYFVTTESPLLYKLWRSDGTAAGTQRVTSAGPVELDRAVELESAAGALYFHGLGRVDEVTRSNGLWRSDGSAQGTVEVTSFYTGTEWLYGAPYRLIGTSSQLFFVGPDSTLWRSDGTPSGTLPLEGVSVGESAFSGVADASGRLFFAGTDPGGDTELWVSDGTGAGTRRVKDINPLDRSALCCLTRLGNTVLFSANGGQLWRSDGTEAGTILIHNPAVAPLGIYGYSSFGNPYYQMAEAFGKLFFAADDGVHGRELWVSDGTSSGTRLLKDINPTGSSFPDALTPIGSTLFFMNRDETSFALWRTDGTEAGTSRVHAFPDSLLVGGDQLIIGGVLYFLVHDSGGDKLWTSNGTAVGTVPVANLPAAGSLPSDLIVVNGRLFFVATDSAHGRELWTSDGTAAGTAMVKDIQAGPRDALPFGLSAIGGRLLFMTPHGNDYELWTSDGTTSGTMPITVLGLNNSDWNWEPADFTPVGSRLFFTTGLHIEGGRQLWVSDGTAAGTRVVKNSAGYPVAAPLDMAAVNGRLLFSQSYSPYGRELWSSDGSPGGTALVKDINPGPASAAISGIRQVRSDGWALLAASAGPDGVELWQTDGTAAGTRQLQDLAPGAGSSNPVWFVAAGGQVYFIADDGRSGPELWSLSQAVFPDLSRFKRYVPLVAR